MYNIMSVEIDYKKGQKIPKGEPFLFERHNDLLNAMENMHYLLSCFGKYYNFYILCLKKDLP